MVSVFRAWLCLLACSVSFSMNYYKVYSIVIHGLSYHIYIIWNLCIMSYKSFILDIQLAKCLVKNAKSMNLL